MMQELLVGSPQTAWEPPDGWIYKTPSIDYQGEPRLNWTALSVLEVTTDALTAVSRDWCFPSDLAKASYMDVFTHQAHFWFLRQVPLIGGLAPLLVDCVPRAPREAVRQVAVNGIAPNEYSNVRFIGGDTLLRINTEGHADKIRKVIDGVRRFFGTEEVTVEWPERTPLARPITLRVYGGEDFEAALDLLQRFDHEWWYDQDTELHRLIGVHLV